MPLLLLSSGAQPDTAINVNINAPAPYLEDRPINFSAAVIDPGGAHITSYFWILGDGKTATTATVSHAYDTATQYKVSLTVRDSKGNYGTTDYTINVESKFGFLNNPLLQTVIALVGIAGGGIAGGVKWLSNHKRKKSAVDDDENQGEDLTSQLARHLAARQPYYTKLYGDARDLSQRIKGIVEDLKEDTPDDGTIDSESRTIRAECKKVFGKAARRPAKSSWEKVVKNNCGEIEKSCKQLFNPKDLKGYFTTIYTQIDGLVPYLQKGPQSILVGPKMN